ncbi:hypothetical protein P148_SR1C00001G0879 [candidate division SR1 bacterium RAAC1_SR1_1]|nr:hypothetical protein P148_SR1C00001G0879 [candidate division SR1 bacterium RAAC1_SR1_1]
MILRNVTQEILHGVKPGSVIDVPDSHPDRINQLLEDGFEDVGEIYVSSLEDFNPMICYRALKEIIRRNWDGDVDALTIVDMKLKYIELGLTERIPLITDEGEDCQGFSKSYVTTKEQREKQQSEQESPEPLSS